MAAKMREVPKRQNQQDHPSSFEAGDLMGPGVRRIAEDAKLPYNVTRGLIDAGYAPAFKLGGRWYARRSEWAAVMTANRSAG